MDKTRAVLMQVSRQMMANMTSMTMNLAVSHFVHFHNLGTTTDSKIMKTELRNSLFYSLENDSVYNNRGALFSETQKCNQTFDEDGLVEKTYTILTNALEETEPGLVNHSMEVVLEVVKLSQESMGLGSFKLLRILPLLEGLGKLQIDLERIFNASQATDYPASWPTTSSWHSTSSPTPEY